MRQFLDALIAGATIAAVVLWGGASAGGSGNHKGEPPSTVQVGLGIRVDSSWISLNGTWSVGPAARGETAGAVTHRFTIGTFPNVAGRARKGAAFLRAVRTATICVAKQLSKRGPERDRSEGR
jgi:hypothetical protein